jgi:hypothetical protein
MTVVPEDKGAAASILLEEAEIRMESSRDGDPDAREAAHTLASAARILLADLLLEEMAAEKVSA